MPALKLLELTWKNVSSGMLPKMPERLNAVPFFPDIPAPFRSIPETAFSPFDFGYMAHLTPLNLQVSLPFQLRRFASSLQPIHGWRWWLALRRRWWWWVTLWGRGRGQGTHYWRRSRDIAITVAAACDHFGSGHPNNRK
ncbi:hypothetical protein CR513_24485, partial [Mucuna pruriens]